MNITKLIACLKSWHTTVIAIIGALIILLTQAKYFLDADPTTVVDEQVVVAALTILGIGIAAKDGDKKSEDVGLK